MSHKSKTNGQRSGKAFVGSLALLVGFLLMAQAALANNDLLVLEKEPGTWPMANGNYAGWNFSPLDRINTENVKDLQVKWTFQIGVTDSLEAPPLVVNNTMYILTPKPNTLIALDLTRDGYIKWEFQPEMPGLEQATACCGAQTRGLTYAEGKIFFNTLDGQLFAVDAETGEPIWRTDVVDLSISETTTTAPLVVGDNVIIGNEGGERGVRGWVAAYHIDTGELVWKYYNMGPDEEMGIGPRFKPFYPDDQVPNPGVSTWYGDSWKTGGGTTWGYFTYDPESNLFFYGTANCGPWNPDYRRDPATAPGLDQYTNKYCASLIARDATTGEMIWAYSYTPQDQWDFDEPGQAFVIDLEINGEMRKALVKPGRNGFLYVHDRLTGELLTEPVAYTNVTWAHGIDMETGRPIFNEKALVYTGIPTEDLVCPFIAGNNWFNDAYSPVTGLIYFQAENRCTRFEGLEGEYVPGESYTLYRATETQTGPGGWQGELQAWNPVTGEKVWGLKSYSSRDNKPVLATAGNLIFGGTDQGVFRAVDARTGEVLWTFRTGGDFRNSPISYLGPDGRQYVAVITSRAPNNEPVNPDVAPDAAARYRRTGTTLYVFGLP
ncbi:MAG: PQQ-dependent dehydrogenase, methanol/ethanol family [Firmicutes bacterium]|nr:PQQ-dependent dehydrogenase, methanol/ethanol family [Bacillota bacterium]